MNLLRKVSHTALVAAVAVTCNLMGESSDQDERGKLFFKSYYSMTEKDHVLYDALRQERLYFSDLDIFDVGDVSGVYEESYERAFDYYKAITGGRRVSRSSYSYYIKKVADYLYNLLFPPESEDGIGTSPVTGPVEFSSNFATMLVGIDYEGTSSALSNCIHDVEHMMEKLLTPKLGVKMEDVIYMTDHQPGDLYPTGKNLRKQFKKFANRLNYARNGYFHYSGHGTYMRDDDGDETDRKDEALCPVDCDYNGMIRDDELFDDFICELSDDVKLVMTTDCCHSGTIMDLPYRWSRDGTYVLQQRKMTNKELEALADVVMISGCRDDQTSADGGFMKDVSKGSGAMTAAYLETLKFYNYDLTYRELIDKMHDLLEFHGYPQRPVLSTTRVINIDDKFMTSRSAMRP